MSNLFGYSFVGKREDFDTGSVTVDKHFVTVNPLGVNKNAMDTVSYGYHRVTEDATVEAGSTDSVINITGHSAKRGDIIRIKSSSNSINEFEVTIRSVTANTITLEGVVSADFAAGDTVDILRPIAQRFDDSGATLASVVAPPIQIMVDDGSGATATSVLDDQSTPANTVPIPVRLYGATGNINITSEDLNVQLSHSAANPDSVQIGDGAEVVAINASNEMQIADDTARTSLDNIDNKITAFDLDSGAGTENNAGVSLRISQAGGSIEAKGQKTSANSIPAVLSSEQETILSAIQTAVETFDDAISGTEMQVDVVTTPLTAALDGSELQVDLVNIGGAATETTLSTLNGKFSSLGQKASAASAPMVLSSEQETILSAIQTAVETLDNAIDGTEMQVDLVDIGDIATETTLSAINTKLPAALGQQNSAGSFSVVLASDAEVTERAKQVKDFQRLDFSSNNVTSAGYTQLIASTSSDVVEAQIFYGNGTTLYLATGAAASETDLLMIPPGFDGKLPLDIASGTRLSLKSVDDTVNTGELVINLIGNN
jgi:hypothetical protein